MKVDLLATPYTREKKGDTKRLRNSGSIPAVMYGHGEENRSISVDQKAFKKVLIILQQEAVMLDILIKDKKYLCVIKAIQHNPMTGDLMHIDFQQIHRTEKIKTIVPIHLLGTAPGIKSGGILDQHLHGVVVRCLPGNFPATIDIEVSNLDLHQTIHLSDINIENIEFELKKETSIVSVVVARAVEEVVKPAAAPEEVEVEEATAAEGAGEEKEPDKTGKKEPDKAGKKEPDKAGKKETEKAGKKKPGKAHKQDKR